MINFQSVQWLVLLPIILGLGWMFFRLHLFRPWRLFIVTLLVFALADPGLDSVSKGLDLWVLVDRSESAAPYLAPNIKEWEELLKKNKASNDRLFFIDYASDIVERSENTASVIRNLGSTLTGEAVFKAASLAKSSRASKILLLTDGYGTDSLKGLSRKLKKQNIQLDYRLVRFQKKNDIRVERLSLPEKALPGEKFLIEAIISGKKDLEFDYQLFCDGQEIDQGKMKINKGNAFLRRSDSKFSGGLHRYELKIYHKDDTVSGNNSAEALLNIQGGPRVVLLSAYETDPFKEVLRKQGFEVQHFTDFKTLQSNILTGARLIIFNNVPASQVPEDFLKELSFYVRYQGGGLIMCGGKFSFGTGGYYKSPIDEILPVSMEMKIDHRKLRTSLAIVMDRSGSMANSVAGGQTKMSLANSGAAEAIRLLSATDAASVIAVDTEPNVIIPLSMVGDGEEMTAKAMKVQPGGGGIFVYTGLKVAWEQLKDTQGQKHIILFTDAADSEEPGDYKRLIKEMRTFGATVSVIALGSETDRDAVFIKDIALRGNGRIFFTKDPGSLPAIFAQETVAVARSAFLEDPVKTIHNDNWKKISEGNLKWLEKVDAYNLSYLKEGAQVTLLSDDEYKSPLISWWRKESGRSVAISFPVAGEFSELTRNWSDYGNFLQTITRWAASPDVPAGLSLRHKIDGNTLSMDLYFDQRWNQKFTDNIPSIHIQSQNFAVREGNWRRLSPGRYNTTLDLKSGETVKGVIKGSDFTVPFGPLKAGIDMEWVFDRRKIQDLNILSQLSGGKEITDFGKVWQRSEKVLRQNISSWFLMIALLAFLYELYTSRKSFGKDQTGAGVSYVDKLLEGLDFQKTKDVFSDSGQAPVEEKKADIDRGELAKKRRERFNRAKLK